MTFVLFSYDEPRSSDSIIHSQFFNVDIINILEIKIMERFRISYTIRRMLWAKIFILMDRRMDLGRNWNV